MFYKRWIVIGLAALLLFGVVSAIGGAGQREAWMEGYIAGRLSTGSDGGAALAPYMMPGGPFGPHYGGFGFGPGLFLGLGFLALGVFLLSRRFHGGRWNEGAADFHQHMREEARRWRQQHQGSWSGEPDQPGPGDEQRIV
jgi:hypothetical protein